MLSSTSKKSWSINIFDFLSINTPNPTQRLTSQYYQKEIFEIVSVATRRQILNIKKYKTEHGSFVQVSYLSKIHVKSI